MAPQITVSVLLSSPQWSVTRARGDKLVVVINVVEGKSIRLWESEPNIGLHERLDDAHSPYMRTLICTQPDQVKV